MARPVLRSKSASIALNASATSLTVSRGAVSENDLLIAVIMGRSTLTPPTGWALATSVSITDPIGTFQRLAVYTKRAGASEPSDYDFTQSTAARFYGYILAYYDTDGGTVKLDNSNSYFYTTTFVTLIYPDITINNNNSVVVLAPSSIAAVASPGTTQFSYINGPVSLGYPATAEKRLDGAAANVNAGTATNYRVTIDLAAGTNRSYLVAHAVLYSEAPVEADFDFDYRINTATQYEVTIPASSVGASLTAFPVYTDLSDMPPSFWSNVRSDGGNVRVVNSAGALIPFDLAILEPTRRKGTIFARVSLSSSADTTVYVKLTSDTARLAVNDTNGRDAVWADYRAVTLLGFDPKDRTGRETRASGDSAFVSGSVVHTFSTDPHQGGTWDGTYYYIVDTNAIYKYDASWNLIASNLDPIGDTGLSVVNHCGDPCTRNGILYIPLEYYSGGSHSDHYMVEFDCSDLSFITSHALQTSPEISSVCFCPVDNYYYVTDYVNGAIQRYDEDFNYIGPMTLLRVLNQPQGIEWFDNAFFVTIDSLDETLRIEYDGFTMRNLTTDTPNGLFGVGVSGNYEGIWKVGDSLYTLSDPSSANSFVTKHENFDIGLAAGAGWRNVSTDDTVEIPTTEMTVWTMGVTASLATKTANRALATYHDHVGGSGANDRASLAYRFAETSVALWDDTNSWLMPASDIDPTVDTPFRVHAYYNGSTGRGFYYNGTLAASQSGITSRTGFSALRLGTEDASNAETIDGHVGFAYLRAGVLSADWIAAEYANLSTPSTFYQLTEVVEVIADFDFDYSIEEAGGTITADKTFSYAIDLGKLAAFDYAVDLGLSVAFDYALDLGQSLTSTYAIDMGAARSFNYAIDLGASFGFDYGYDIGQTFTFGSAIGLGRSFDFDYVLNDILSADFAFAYAIDAGASFSFDYAYEVQANFSFDYAIQLSAAFTSDYAIQFGATFAFDYGYEVQASFVFDYGYELGKSFDFDYAVDLGASFDFDYGFGFSRDFTFDYRIATVVVTADFSFDYLINSVPLTGFMLVPETPIIERWEYLTSVAVSRDGSEQRSALRREPRFFLEYTFIVTTEDERRLMFDLLYRNARAVQLVPLYAYGAQITSPISAGGVVAQFDADRTDIREGDLLYYMTPDGETGAFELAQSVGTNSVTFAFGAAFDLPAGSWIMPALEMTADTGAGLNMRAFGGAVSVRLQAMKNRRALPRPGVSSALTVFDGFPVLDQRHLADDGIPDSFDGGLISVDEAADVRRVVFAPQASTFVGGARSYRIERNGPRLDAWREFVDAAKGKRSPFLISSYRQDLKPAANTPGTVLDVIGRDYLEKFERNAFKRLEIEAGGAVSRHIVTEVTPITGGLRLTLGTAYSSAEITRVSYLTLVRLNSDVITLTHEQLQTKIDISVRSVDA